ncbi:MAG: nucleoside phosphorylase [Candidatus Choladocola sp.]|nr:nucleoside phosphorylase [Candidatus Choladocola sp.]
MEKMPHIQLDTSIQTTAAVLPGDPARVDHIASFLTNVRQEGFSREYKSITGEYKGLRILAISTGMGGPSTAICVEELANLGVTDMIRIGSCGALQPHLSLGQLVICDRAVCDDGTSQTYTHYLRYASPQFHDPQSDVCSDSSVAFKDSNGAADKIQFSYASRELWNECMEAAKSLSFPFAAGPTRCHDALYQQIKPSIDEFYSGKGIYASDMETAALFAVGSLRNVRTASILNVVVEWKKDVADGIGAYRDGETDTARGEENEILVALEALYRISQKHR